MVDKMPSNLILFLISCVLRDKGFLLLQVQILRVVGRLFSFLGTLFEKIDEEAFQILSGSFNDEERDERSYESEDGERKPVLEDSDTSEFNGSET